MNDRDVIGQSEDAGDRALEERLRSLPRREMAPARRAETSRQLRELESLSTGRDERLAWWRRPVPIWRAIAASIVLACASGLITAAVSRTGSSALNPTRVEAATHETAGPGTIIFVDHRWQAARTRPRSGQPTLRNWTFMPIEHGEHLQ